ncbi:MAG TPA: DNA polymerase III subunit delta' [Beijerinckiaceae bacterium]|nr:DNA polymerase III subunit delta' [Beijerinckiaceae bacterium]
MASDPEDDGVEEAALARHPREQTALFGHAAAEQAFVDGIREGRLHHAWLVGGPRGIGKATLAYRVARALLAGGGRDGLAVDPDHRAARQVAALSHPNLAVLSLEMLEKRRASIPVDAVRRALSLFSTKAADAGYRVCIVDSAEDLNVASANALLKLVEEPPERSVFLIVSHAPGRVLATIRSRCRKLLLEPLGEADLRAAIGSLGPPWSETEEGALADAIAFADGSVRRALELLDEDKAAVVRQTTALLDSLPGLDPKRVLAFAESLGRKGAEDSYRLVVDLVLRWASERLREGAALGPARLAPLVEACEKVGRSAREVEVYNLDKRPFVLATFGDLAEAVRRTA